jgi:hypothetical protein
MNCREVKGLLGTYLDDEVTPSERTLIEAHLADCAACRQRLQATQVLQERIKQTLQAKAAFATPSAGAWARLQSQLPRQRVRSPWLAGNVRVAAWALATLMVIIITVNLLLPALPAIRRTIEELLPPLLPGPALPPMTPTAEEVLTAIETPLAVVSLSPTSTPTVSPTSTPTASLTSTATITATGEDSTPTFGPLPTTTRGVRFFPTRTPWTRPEPLATIALPANYFTHVYALGRDRTTQLPTIRGIIQNESGWEVAELALPAEIELFGAHDYALASNRLLYWGGSLFFYDLNTGQNGMLFGAVTSVAWAPNGEAFAYNLAPAHKSELRWRYREEDRLLAPDVTGLFSISPSGEMIAFTRELGYPSDYPSEGPPGLYIVSIERGEERQISDVDRAGKGGSGPSWAPLWSPNEESILLRVKQDNRNKLIWIATDGSFSSNLDTSLSSALRNETNDPSGTWCDTGFWLLNDNLLVGGIGFCEEPALAPPAMLYLVTYELDPTTGSVGNARLYPNPDEKPPLGGSQLFWNVPSESVFIITSNNVENILLSTE